MEQHVLVCAVYLKSEDSKHLVAKIINKKKKVSLYNGKI